MLAVVLPRRRRASLALVLSFAAAGTLRAQGNRNVDLLANLVPTAERFSGLWGFVDPGSGDEYALLGSTEGTHVIDCSDPRNPIERGMIPTDNPGPATNRWREMRTFGRHAYVVSEAHGGVQIIDLAHPRQPLKVKTWGAALWSNAHNIGMDEGSGIAYVCGTDTGMHVLDVKTDPTEPVRLAVFTGAYVHDAVIQGGYAHLSEINANRYTVLDVRGLPTLSLLGSIASAGKTRCHSAWPSRDDQIIALCHEVIGGELAVYDIQNPRLPRLLSLYQTGGANAVVHNPMLIDYVCHVAWNTEGYHAVDLSEPTAPLSVGYYDTYTGAGGTHTVAEGLWGVYARQPSGVVYGSDRTSGLFVLKPKCTMARYGAATPDSHTPQLRARGAAWIGNSRFRLAVDGARPSSVGAIALATAPSSHNDHELRLLVDLRWPTALVPFATDPAGEGSVALPVPEWCAPGTAYAQAFVLDPAAPLGISASHGHQLQVFAR